MPKIRWLALALVGLFVFLSCSPEAPKFSFNTAERRGTLSNGIRFVVMPDASTKLVEVDVRYDVGSREDPIGKSGLAHLVEHLMFQARPDGPTSPPLFKAIMDRSTFFNAYTNWDTTHYMTQSQATPENFDAKKDFQLSRAEDVLKYGSVAATPKLAPPTARLAGILQKSKVADAQAKPPTPKP